jgi:alpha-glucosidase (family GH31 glycosyl hydrolase)
MKNSRSVFLLHLLASLVLFLPQALYAGVPNSFPGSYDPIADPRAVVIIGSARFSILTPQLIRMEWAADGEFEDRASLVFLNRRLPIPAFTHETTPEGNCVIRTGALRLVYTPGKSDGRFTAETLNVSFVLGGRTMVWKAGMADTGNLLGTTRTLDRVRGSDVQLEPGLVSRDGWTVVDDSTRALFDSDDFSFRYGEESPWPWVVTRPAGERQDWYFFGYGHAYKRALYDYTRVAGKIPLPPRFAFGAWWSRYWSYTDQEFEKLVQEFHAHETPLDVLVIDMDWHPTFNQVAGNDKLDASGHRLGWTGYSWNKLLFPNPDQFLAKIHEEGLKATVNLHPAGGVEPWEDAYPEMARSSGIDPATKQYIPFDITDRKFAANYLKYMIHPLERQGINFFWLDWQQEDTTRTAGLNPTWWLNYVFFSDQEREGKRALLFHRWGGLGNHRYQIGFSGDTISVWDSLAFQPYFTATAANVGYAYWSHDIGGHMPGAIDPELYLRWIQWGIFSPILRTHTTKNPDAERRIWAYPEPYSDLMRESIRLRYAIQPYIYSEARKTYDTGLAFLHPLYYDWPEVPEAYTAKNEYMFGENILVDPITQPVAKDSQLAMISLWLPPGDWFEWDSGAIFKGPVTIRRNFSLRQIPLYVKTGSIIPMQRVAGHTAEKAVDPVILTIFPLKDGQESKYRLYEDAGDTPAYQNGEGAWTPIRAAMSKDGTTLNVSVSPIEGHYDGMQIDRSYELHLPGSWPPSSVKINGEELFYRRKPGQAGWRFDGSTLTTIISIPRFHVRNSVTIAIRTDIQMVHNRGLLDDFAGKMMRLSEAYSILNANWPVAWSPDALIDCMQTGDRITYNPSSAFDELRRLGPKLAAIPDLIEAMHATERSPAFATGSSDSNPSKPDRRLADYNSAVDSAMAHLADISETQPRASINHASGDSGK